MVAPAAMPPKLKRRPFDLSQLPPEMQQQIMSAGQMTLEDGSTIYADGSATGAGDSPDDFAVYGTPNAGTMQGAGFGYSGPSAPGAMPEDVQSNPLGGPMFKRYRQTAKAGMPGQEPANDNPMDDPLPNPFETPAPARSVTVPGGASVTNGSPQAASTPASKYTQADDPMKKKGNTYAGRFGRRQTARSMPTKRR